MGFLDKLKFWKKKDEFADLKDDNYDPAAGNYPSLEPGPTRDIPGMPQSQPMQDMPGMPPQHMEEDKPFDVKAPPPAYQPTQSSQPTQQQGQPPSRSNELLIAKMDILIAKIDSVSQRVENLERMAMNEVKEEKKRKNYW
ncbi:hypothetical protein ACFL1H_05520 [Nanoarchaeota archaeon]